MSKEIFAEMILNSDESDTIDFKSQDYDFSKESKKRCDFIKDILSMANTPREKYESSFIIIGVKNNFGKENTIVGIDTFKDDVEYQNIISSKSLSSHPKIKTHNIIINDKNILIIEVCVDINNTTPYVYNKDDCSKIEKGIIYYRVGSTNVKAEGNNKDKICKWFSSFGNNYDGSWEEFKYIIKTRKMNCETILILPNKISKVMGNISNISLLLPSLVVDLDLNSELDGAYSKVEHSLSEKKVVHRYMPRNTIDMIKRTTAWYFARGVNPSSCEESADITYKDWAKSGSEIVSNIKNSCAKIGEKQIIIIFFIKGEKIERYEEDFIAQMTTIENAKKFVVSNKNIQKNEEFFKDFEDEIYFLDVGLDFFSSEISRILFTSQECAGKTLPSAINGSLYIPPADTAWINETLDMCYLEHEFNEQLTPKIFRMGGKPDWETMYRGYDCEREVTRTFYNRVLKSLNNRKTTIYHLHHSPGGGGTTIAKRIAWKIHETYPTGELVNYSSISNAFACIQDIYLKTNHPLFIIIDSSLFNIDDIENIYSIVRANQIPVVFLQISRRNISKFSSDKNTFWIPQILTKNEVDKFKDYYLQDSENKKTQIMEIVNNAQQWKCINFGLAVYSEKYLGIETYVSNRLSVLSPLQKEIFILYALAYYYGQQSLSAQYFFEFLDKKQNECIDLEDLFLNESSSSLDMLVYNDKNGEYRIMHYLIAYEILKNLLSKKIDKSDSRFNKDESWKESLSTYGVLFAEIISKASESKRTKEILSKIFIERNEESNNLTKKRYSNFFEDIPNIEGKFELFKVLCDLFPLEAHIHAHRARMCSNEGDFDTAIKAIETALKLDENDAVLHHIYGTILKNKIKIEFNITKNISDIYITALESFSCYKKSRGIDKYNEHAYVSPMELCIDILKFSKVKLKLTLAELLNSKNPNNFYISILNEFNCLMYDFKSISLGMNKNDYISTLEAQMDEIHGNYSEALMILNNLLSSATVSKPNIRRLIVHTYNNKFALSEAGVDQKTQEKIVKLLEVNMNEEKNYSKNMFLWLRAIRKLNAPPNLNKIIENISYWKSETKDIEPIFYLSILLSIQAIAGNRGAIQRALLSIEECKNISRYDLRRTYSREWLGDCDGIKSIIPSSHLGEWDANLDFYSNFSRLRQVEGRIFRIIDNGKGFIELDCGLKAFFIPSRFNVVKGRDENKKVQFYLGFSYDGLIAWAIPKT